MLTHCFWLQDLLRGQRRRPLLHRGQRRLLLSGAGQGRVPLGPDEPAGGDPGLPEHLGVGAGQTERRQESGFLPVHGGSGLQSGTQRSDSMKCQAWSELWLLCEDGGVFREG